MAQQFDDRGRRDQFASPAGSDSSGFEAVPLPKLEGTNSRPPRWPNYPCTTATAMAEPNPERRRQAIPAAVAAVSAARRPEVVETPTPPAVRERVLLVLDGAPESERAFDIRSGLSAIFGGLGLERLSHAVARKTFVSLEGPLNLDRRNLVGVSWEDDGVKGHRLCRPQESLILESGESAIVHIIGNKIYEGAAGKDEVYALSATATLEKVGVKRR